MGVSQWNGAAVLDKLEAALLRGLDDAGAIAVKTEQDLIGIKGPPASSPGDPPHRRSGHLQEAQDHRVEREGRGGVLVVEGARIPNAAAAYAPIVAKRRPWLRKGVDQAAGRIVATVADSLRQALR